jgi:hypothetical protein
MIPKLIHFFHGPDADAAERPFAFVHYIAIASAALANPGYRVVLHCVRRPEGAYWEAAEPRVEVRAIAAADLAGRVDPAGLALRRLDAEGGICLGLDTITLQTFDDLLAHAAVFGALQPAGAAMGLGPSVMLAEPGAPFIKRLLAAGPLADSAAWSVRAWQLAAQHPGEVTVLDRGAFHFPGPDPQGARDLFVEDRSYPAARGHSLWESLCWNLVSKLDERNVVIVDTTYNRLARRVAAADAETFKPWRERELRALLQVPIRANLGCGANKRAGWLNVDSQPAASPDMVFDITTAPWPLADGSVGEAELSHVLEHVGERFETVVKELYRVCAHGARVQIKLPHPRHDWFLADPTHSRALLPLSFELLDAEACKAGLMTGQTATPLAVYWRVDFETMAVEFVPSPDLARLDQRRLLQSLGYPFQRERNERMTRWVKRAIGRPVAPASPGFGARRLQFLARHLGNMIGEVRLELRVRKDVADAGSAKPPGADALRI